MRQLSEINSIGAQDAAVTKLKSNLIDRPAPQRNRTDRSALINLI